MTIDLTSVHVLHRVFSFVGVGEFNIAETTSVLRVETIGREFNVFDFSIAAEDFDDVFLCDIASEATDVDA